MRGKRATEGESARKRTDVDSVRDGSPFSFWGGGGLDCTYGLYDGLDWDGRRGGEEEKKSE